MQSDDVIPATPDGLLIALQRAAERAAASGCSVHVSIDDEGFFTSDFIPAPQYRKNWLKVGCDGRIEDVNRRAIIGNVGEFWA